MSFGEHKKELNGLNVVVYQNDLEIPNPEATAVRISVEYDEEEQYPELLANLAGNSAAATLGGLVLGVWDFESGDNAGLIEQVVSLRDSFPNLKNLFVGDIIGEETEASWINQSDLSPLFNSFPNLEYFGCRGSDGLSLGTPQHAKLKKLVIEGGGLPGEIVREIVSATLPELEHLELWLGTDSYGRSVTQADLQPILDAKVFPKLRYLGLRNDEEADATAKLLDGAAILDQIEELDMSLGGFGDGGAEALLANPKTNNLKKLNLDYHFMSEDVVKQLTAGVSCEVIATDPQQEDSYGDETYRYISVSE